MSMEQQAREGAQQLWAKVQQTGIAKVGLGLMAGSVIFYPFASQRGIWAARFPELLLMLVLAGYMAYRELTGREPLPQRFWWAPAAAALYLLLWALTGISLKLGSLLFLAGAGLLGFAVLQPWYGWLTAVGLNWRYALYGYRRVILLGAVLALAALFLTWQPAVSSAGWWSGGYTMRYTPGFYFPASKGINKTGSVLAQAALLGSILYAALAPQFAVPRWYHYIPLIAAGWGFLFVLLSGTIYWGQLLFLAGIGLIAWGGYQLGVTGVAEGRFDLREVPLEKVLGRWL